MTRKVFKCSVTNNRLEFIVEENIATLDVFEFDAHYPKSFILLLRETYDSLKKNDIEKIREAVSYNDWENCLKETTWKIHSENKSRGFYIIECDINQFLKNTCRGIGIDWI